MKVKFRLSLPDIAIFQLIVIMIAFRDYSTISIVSQIIAFITVAFFRFSRNSKIEKDTVRFISYRGLFLAWCCIGIVVSSQPQVVKSFCVAVCLRIITSIAIIIYVKNEYTRVKFMKYLTIAGCVLCLRMLIVVPAGAWGSERVGVYLAHTAGNSYGFTNITYALGIIAAFLFAEKSAIKNSKLRVMIIIIFSLFSLMSGSKKQIFFLLVTIIIYGMFSVK